MKLLTECLDDFGIPISEVDDSVSKWVRTQNPRFRTQISKLPNKQHEKDLAILAKSTPTKGKAPKRLFQLHRGMSTEEFYSHFKTGIKTDPIFQKNTKSDGQVVYKAKTSWSYDKNLAYGFSHAKNMSDPEPGILVSLWVPEHLIVRLITSDPGDEYDPQRFHLAHYASKEKEVIVDKFNQEFEFEYQKGADLNQRYGKRK